MDCVTWGVAGEGDESPDDVFDMMGDDGVEGDFLKNGWGLYCLMKVSWWGK
jgi:hypothetical protein